MDNITATDRNGLAVRAGDLVRLVELDMDVLDYLEPHEIADIRSMIGEPLPVEKVTTSGLVTVTKWFDRGLGKRESHTLSLAQQQFELHA